MSTAELFHRWRQEGLREKRKARGVKAGLSRLLRKPFLKAAIRRLGSQDLPHELQEKYVERIFRDGTSDQAYEVLMKRTVASKELKNMLARAIDEPTLEQAYTLCMAPDLGQADICPKDTVDDREPRRRFIAVLAKEADAERALKVLREGNLNRHEKYRLVEELGDKLTVSDVLDLLLQDSGYLPSELVTRICGEGSIDQAVTLLRERKNIYAEDMYTIAKVIRKAGNFETALEWLNDERLGDVETWLPNTMDKEIGAYLKERAEHELIQCVAENGGIGKLVQLPVRRETIHALNALGETCSLDEAYAALMENSRDLMRYGGRAQYGGNHFLNKIYEEGTAEQAYNLIVSGAVVEGGDWFCLRFKHVDESRGETVELSSMGGGLYAFVQKIAKEGTEEQARSLLESGKVTDENSMNLLEHRVHGKPLKPLDYYV